MGVIYGVNPTWGYSNLSDNARFFSSTKLVVQSGLVLNLDAGVLSSYPDSGNTWTDLSGNGINGTLTNAPTYSSTNGGSLVFDGLDDYATTSCSQFQSGNNPFTIEVWFRWFGNGTNQSNLLFSYGEDVVGGNRLPLVAISGTNKIQFEFGSQAGLVYSSTTIQTNTWYQTVCNYDLSSTKVYINGSLENTTSYSSANVSLNGYNGQKAAIGCLFSSFGTVGVSEGFTRRYGTYNGNISVVKYYNRALTAAEIQQNYLATKSRYFS
jgi:hypothetical protein